MILAMTVKELITELQRMGPTMEVYVHSDNAAAALVAVELKRTQSGSKSYVLLEGDYEV